MFDQRNKIELCLCTLYVGNVNYIIEDSTFPKRWFVTMRDRDKIVFSENFKLLLDSFLFISRYEDTLIKLPSTWSSCKSNDSKIGLRPIIFQPEFPPIVSLKGISICSFWIDLSLHFFFFFVITFLFVVKYNFLFYFQI